MVLDIQWLQSLATITIDYNALSMTCSHEGRWVSLSGESRSISSISTYQLRKMVQTDAIAYCYQLVA